MNTQFIEDVRSFQPRNYPEMEAWLNSLPAKDWIAVLGAYSAFGYVAVISWLRGRYTFSLTNWNDVSLRLFFNERNINDFKGRSER